MKGKIIAILIIINLILVGGIYNLINKDYLNNEKIIVKAMTGTEYENSITSLNTAHEEYANYIEESKKKIASAITDMGVSTSEEETLETMANNIKSIARIVDYAAEELLKGNHTAPTYTYTTTKDYSFIFVSVASAYTAQCTITGEYEDELSFGSSITNSHRASGFVFTNVKNGSVINISSGRSSTEAFAYVVGV